MIVLEEVDDVYNPGGTHWWRGIDVALLGGTTLDVFLTFEQLALSTAPHSPLLPIESSTDRHLDYTPTPLDPMNNTTFAPWASSMYKD